MKVTQYASRYDYGVKEIKHKGKSITTSLASDMDDIISEIPNNYAFEVGQIPIYHANRPDLTSNTFYDSPAFWWFLLHFNAIDDPFEKFNTGDFIRIPKL